MYCKRLKECQAFVAGDRSQLREIFNARKEKLALRYSLAWATLKPGKNTLLHRLDVSEVYFIIQGTGKIHIDNEEKVVQQYDTVYIPPQALQHIENIGTEDLEFLCIVDPAWHPEAEIIIER